jgi:hypothetical protein
MNVNRRRMRWSLRNQITAIATAMAMTVQRSWLLPVSSPGSIEAVDHGQAEAVEGNHQGKYYRIGIFGPEPEHPWNTRDGNGEQARLEPEVRIEGLFLVHAHQHVGADPYCEGKQEQGEFHVAPWLGRGTELAHWPTSQVIVGLGVGDGAAGDGAAAVADASGAGAGSPVAGGLGGAVEAAGDADGVAQPSSGEVVPPVSSRFFTMRWAS